MAPARTRCLVVERLDWPKMRARSVAALASALAGALTFAAPAAALEPGVFVDPGSPAGKEYSIPLSELRGAATGHAPIGSQAQPLFGVGIGPARASGQPARGVSAGRTGSPRRPRGQRGGGANAGSRSGGRSGTGARGGALPGTSGRASGALPARGPALAALTHQGSPALEVALIGALVVLGGFGIGALVAVGRRRL
jgi:hypothetical protein